MNKDTTNDLSGWGDFLRDAEPKKNGETLTCPVHHKDYVAVVGRRGWNFCPHCHRHHAAMDLIHL